MYHGVDVCIHVYGYIIIYLTGPLQMVLGLYLIIYHHEQCCNKFFNNLNIVPVYQGCFLAATTTTTWEAHKYPKN